MNYREYQKQAFEKNPILKKEYDKLSLEYKIIEQIVNERVKQGLTQEDLAVKTNIPQANISRLENGNLNPSVKFLEKIACGLGKKLEISFK